MCLAKGAKGVRGQTMGAQALRVGLGALILMCLTKGAKGIRGETMGPQALRVGLGYGV